MRLLIILTLMETGKSVHSNETMFFSFSDGDCLEELEDPANNEDTKLKVPRKKADETEWTRVFVVDERDSQNDRVFKLHEDLEREE